MFDNIKFKAIYFENVFYKFITSGRNLDINLTAIEKKLKTKNHEASKIKSKLCREYEPEKICCNQRYLFGMPFSNTSDGYELFI